jgi:hypothetical protein
MRKKQLKPKLVPLPCPFCGTKPKLAPQDPANEGDAWGMVYCSSSRCAVAPSVKDGQASADERGTGAYMDCAIRRWNKRAAPPAPGVKLDKEQAR